MLSPDETMPPARDAASRAIPLLDRLPSPFATLGSIAAVHDWDSAEGGRRFQHAIELNPAHPAAPITVRDQPTVPLGQFAEAATELQRAIDADPLSVPICVSVGLRNAFWGTVHRGRTRVAGQPGSLLGIDSRTVVSGADPRRDGAPR